MRKPFVCGNWKLNLRRDESLKLSKEIARAISDMKHVEVVIAPVVTVLSSIAEHLTETKLSLAAQNVFFEDHGAFTGEWSVAHLTEIGCRYCIVGHSERRQYFSETSEIVAKKARVCLQGGLVPIVCIGETLAQRETGETKDVLLAQLQPVLGLDIILAYEPIWAIGTGRAAMTEQAEEVHAYLRQFVGPDIRIIYGGSVNPANAKDLLTQPNIDGALVGGASLKADSFMAIVQATSVL